MEWNEKIAAYSDVTDREMEWLSLTPFPRITIVVTSDGDVVIPDNADLTGAIIEAVTMPGKRLSSCWIVSGKYRETDDELDFSALDGMSAGMAYMSYYDLDARQSRRCTVKRLAWETAYGEPPSGKTVHSACGEKNCIRPSHLKLTTMRECVYQVLEVIPGTDDQLGLIGPCLRWTGGKSGTVVPMIKRFGHRWSVHRWIYATCYGPLPAKGQGGVRQMCLTPQCLSPFHLEAFSRGGEVFKKGDVRKYLSFTEERDVTRIDSLTYTGNRKREKSIEDVRVAMETGGEIMEGTGTILMGPRVL